MNRDSVIFNLEEALEELTTILDKIKQKQDYGEDGFRVSMEHLYHHLNFAWNTRNASPEEVNNLNGESFYSWRAFPSDIDLSDPYKRSRTTRTSSAESDDMRPALSLEQQKRGQ